MSGCNINAFHNRSKKHYTPSTKMADLLCDHYSIFLLIFNFDISLGIGEKTIKEVCDEHDVNVNTFLYLVHFILEEGEGACIATGHLNLDIALLIRFLKRSHAYFLEYRLPQIREKLMTALECGAEKDVHIVIERYFDEYAEEVRQHMRYENETVFPYAERLLNGERSNGYDISVFEQKHDQIELKMMELKNILIKYYSGGCDQLMSNALHELYTCGDELFIHNAIEDCIFIPCIKEVERKA